MSGKYALITGSSRGIGRGIALKLAETGATIAVHYYQNEGRTVRAIVTRNLTALSRQVLNAELF